MLCYAQTLYQEVCIWCCVMYRHFIRRSVFHAVLNTQLLYQ